MYLSGSDVGSSVEEIDGYIKKHEAFEKLLATQEEKVRKGALYKWTHFHFKHYIFRTGEKSARPYTGNLFKTWLPKKIAFIPFIVSLSWLIGGFWLVVVIFLVLSIIFVFVFFLV